jgi:hypothetical protein
MIIRSTAYEKATNGNQKKIEVITVHVEYAPTAQGTPASFREGPCGGALALRRTDRPHWRHMC